MAFCLRDSVKWVVVGLCCAAAACTSVDPRFKAGMAQFEAGEHAAARDLWQLAADDGDAAAQHGLGWIYEKGLDVPQDYATSAHWYAKAAAQGHGGAQLNLGKLYDNGTGVE